MRRTLLVAALIMAGHCEPAFAQEMQNYRCTTSAICAVMGRQVTVSQLCRSLSPIEIAIVADLDHPAMVSEGTWEPWAKECQSIRDRGNW